MRNTSSGPLPLSLIGWLFLLSVCVACSDPQPTEPAAMDKPAPDTPSAGPSVRQVLEDSATVLAANKAVLKAMREQDFKQLAGMIHPVKGVRFSFYGFVDTATDQVLSAAWLMVVTGSGKQERLNWGIDTEGKPLLLSFPAYFKEYVYDQDYYQADTVAYKQVLKSMTDPVLMQTAYAGLPFTDNHFPGFDKQYGGLDWKSLRLVFESYQGKPSLVGLINDEWTP